MYGAKDDEMRKKKGGGADEKIGALTNSRLISNTTKSYGNIKITLIGAGQMFGEEDVLSNRNYTTTVTCVSKVGDVFCIKNNEFFRKLRANTESWKIIVLMAMAKEKAMFDRVKQIQRILKEKTKHPTPLKNSFFKDNILLNQHELDLRETLKEIINDYPYAKNHKKIVGAQEKDKQEASPAPD